MKKLNLSKIGKLRQSYQQMIRHYQDEETDKGYLIFNIFVPFLIVFLSETLASHSLYGGLLFIVRNPFGYLANVAIVIASLSLSMLFTKRLGIVLVISAAWFILAFINFVILFFRVTPFTGSDLLLLKDGKDVISKYLAPVQLLMLLFLLALVLMIICYFIFITPAAAKLASPKKSIPFIFGSILAAWALVVIGQHFGFLETEFHELSASYKKNGLYYCFGASVIDVGISKPDDYSSESIEQIVEDLAEPATEASYYSHKPNVIVVQLESFFDINRLKGVKFTRNPVSNLEDLMENYPSGYLSVPVIGAGTVNSEFEVNTGMNIDDFGIGEYPYKTILKEQACESLAYNLKSSGYTAFAIHNNTGDFYERNQVYQNLGFDTFTSVEYMWPDAYTPLDWCKDDILVGEIEQALDSTDGQDYVFTVSVQGHGSYPSEDLTYNRHLEILRTSITDEGYKNQITYYANQLYEMDQFIGNLVEMLKSRKEASILVMYGDHLPSLDLTEDSLNDGTLYQTEYFIWNNAGLVFEDKDQEAYTLSSEILKALEISDGAINAYHQKTNEQLADQSITTEEYLSGLKELEYDILYGDKIYYGGVNPYEPTDLQMGLNPVTITDAQLTKDHVLIVKGTNFTRYSKILVNDEELTTLYIDPETLVAADITLYESDILRVAQSTLSTTKTFILWHE